MLLAEELLLLLAGKPLRKDAPWSATPAALGAAVLVELAETGQLTVDGDTVTFHLADGHPFAPALDTAQVEEAVARAGHELYPALVGRLTEQGVLVRGTRLGFTVWRPADPSHRAALLAEMAGVLVDDVPPTTRTAALAGLLHALRLVNELFPDMRPAGLFRAAWLAKESPPVNAFTRTVAACASAGQDLPSLRWAGDLPDFWPG